MKFALENIIRYGDTDIFPYPIERQIFRDKKEETTQVWTFSTDSFTVVNLDYFFQALIFLSKSDILSSYKINWKQYVLSANGKRP